MNKKVPFAVIAGALAASALVAPISGAAQAPAQVESGLYFTNPEGGNGEFYSFTKWASLTPTEQSNLVLKYKAENIKIFNKVEDKLASLSATVTAESFDGAATAYTEGDIEGTFVDATTGDKIVVAPVVEEVTVESVMAINATSTSTFEVTLPEAVEGATAESFEVTLGEDAVEVTSAVANEDNTVYTLTVADLDGKTGTLKIADKEVLVDYSAGALALAIANVNSANVGNIVERLNAPILNLTDVQEDYAGAYVSALANFSTTRGQIQTNVVKFANEALPTVIKDLNDAVTAYSTAINASKQNEALYDVQVALNTLTGYGVTDVPVFADVVTDSSTPTFNLTALGGSTDVAANRIVAVSYAEAFANAPTSTLTEIQAVIDTVVSVQELATNVSVAVGLNITTVAEVKTAQATIAEVQADVTALPSGDTKDALQTAIDTKNDAIKAKVTGTDSGFGKALVAGLFETVTAANVAETPLNSLVLDGSANQTKIDAAQAAVNVIPATEAVRTQLQIRVNLAQQKLNDAASSTLTNAAKGAVNSLYADSIIDTDAKAETVTLDALKALGAASLTSHANADGTGTVTTIQGEIDTAQAAVKKLPAGALKTNLQAKVDLAQVFNVTVGLDTREEITEAINNFVAKFGNTAYVNLGSEKGQEVAELFRGLNREAAADVATEFKTEAQVQTALNEVITTYNKVLADVNGSQSISEAKTNLQAMVDVILSGFDASEVRELAQAGIIDVNENVTVTFAEKVFNQLEANRADENKANNFKSFDDMVTQILAQ